MNNPNHKRIVLEFFDEFKTEDALKERRKNINHIKVWILGNYDLPIEDVLEITKEIEFRLMTEIIKDGFSPI